MRKLTPEERAAKKALAHVHDDQCGHLAAAEEAPAVAEAPVVEAAAEEAPATDGTPEEVAAEEAVEDKPKRKYTKKSTEEAPADEA